MIGSRIGMLLRLQRLAEIFLHRTLEGVEIVLGTACRRLAGRDRLGSRRKHRIFDNMAACGLR